MDAVEEAYNLSKTVGALCHRLLSPKVCKNDDLCCPTLLHRLRRAMLPLSDCTRAGVLQSVQILP